MSNRKRRARPAGLEPNANMQHDDKKMNTSTDAVQISGLPAADEEPSFFDLISTFANMSTTPVSGLDTCPVCGQEVQQLTFSTHVLECLKELEAVEKEHLLQLDRKMALSLSGGQPQQVEIYDELPALIPSANEGSDADGDAAMQQTTTNTTTNPIDQVLRVLKPTICPEGVLCMRTDRNHFVLLEHPPVSCPMCIRSMPRVDIESHVVSCTGPATNNIQQGEIRDTGGLDVPMQDASMSTVTASNTPSGLQEQSFDFDFKTHDLDQQSREEKRTPTSANKELSHGQLQAMSKLVVEQKDRSGADGLFYLLNKFESLGFTESALRMAIQGEPQPHNASASASTLQQQQEKQP